VLSASFSLLVKLPAPGASTTKKTLIFVTFDLGLTEDEIAFYDALEVNDSAGKVLGDEALKTIARDLVKAIQKSVTIDWTVKESVRAGIRVKVKRILKRHGYPPDKQEKATLTVLEQAELLCADWAA
jgi:type I restriction enzyme R subunit